MNASNGKAVVTDSLRIQHVLGRDWLVIVALAAVLISVLPLGRLRLLLPGALLFLFAWSGYRKIRSQAESHLSLELVRDLADSVYFSGFLLTLWALVDAFVLRNLRGVEGVFQAFSAAVVTTLVGMACRLFLLHFRLGVRPASLAGSSREVAERMLELSGSLQAATDEVRKTSAALREAGEALAGKLEQLVRVALQLEQGFLQAAAGSKQFWETCRGDLRVSVSKIEDEVASAVTKMGAGVSTALGRLESFLAGWESRITGWSAVFETLSGQVQAVEDLMAKVRQVTSSLEVVISTFHDLDQRITSLSGGMQDARLELEKFRPALDGLQLAAESSEKALERTALALTGLGPGLEAVKALIERHVEESRLALEKTVAALAQASGLLAEAAKEQGGLVQQFAANVCGQLAGLVEDFRRFSGIAQTSAGALGDAKQAIIDTTRVLRTLGEAAVQANQGLAELDRILRESLLTRLAADSSEGFSSALQGLESALRRTREAVDLLKRGAAEVGDTLQASANLQRVIASMAERIQGLVPELAALETGLSRISDIAREFGDTGWRALANELRQAWSNLRLEAEGLQGALINLKMRADELDKRLGLSPDHGRCVFSFLRKR